MTAAAGPPNELADAVERWWATAAAAPPSGELAAAVAAFNRASADLESARRQLHRAIDVDARTRPPRRTHPPCGTPGRYRRHLRLGEPVDPACSEAYAHAERHRERRRAG